MTGLGSHWDTYVEQSLSALRGKGLQRYLRPVVPTLDSVVVGLPSPVYNTWLSECGLAEPSVQPEVIPVKLFSLNDYMGLSTHPRVCLAAAKAAGTKGMGPRSSAVVGGYTADHRDLETSLAGLKGTEEALLFPSGFAANQATMAVLGSGLDCMIYSDELNHASIIDGVRLAKLTGATLRVYRHNDMQHLRSLLDKDGTSKRKIVITDSLFSMDGDYADLRSLAALRRQYGFLLAIDEAHATLVCGHRGGGAAEAAGVANQVDVHVGTLSKAVGAQGGFVACSRDMKALLLNKGRPYVFSTSLPLPTVAAASAALQVSEEEPWRREHMQNLIARLGRGLGVEAVSPIVPLILGSEEAALSAAGRLLQQGFHVPAIRPPTVPPGTSRLRISLSAAHTTADVDSLIAAINACGVVTSPLQPFARL